MLLRPKNALLLAVVPLGLAACGFGGQPAEETTSSPTDVGTAMTNLSGQAVSSLPARDLSDALAVTMTMTDATALSSLDGSTKAASPNATQSATPFRTTLAARAETMRWRAIGVGGGGWVQTLASDRNGITRVVRTDTFGAYRWDATRNRWLQMVSTATLPGMDPSLHGGVDEVTVAPSDANRIYMTFAEGLYRSSDAGAHFVRTALPAQTMNANDAFRSWGPVMAVSPTNPDVLYYGSETRGLWRSDDGGATWVVLDALPQAPDQDPAMQGVQSPGVLVWTHRTDPQVVYAHPYGLPVMRSGDGGRTWQPTAAGGAAQPTRIHHGTVDADGVLTVASADGLWRYDGTTWTAFDSPDPTLRWQSFHRNAASGALYAIGEGGALYRSTTLGQSWVRLTTSTRPEPGDPGWLSWKDNNWLSIAQMSFDPVVPNRIWIAEGSGVWFADLDESVDTVTWFSRTRGIEQLVGTDIVAPPGGDVVLGGWDFGLRTKNPSNFEQYSSTHGPIRRFNSVWSLDWSPSNPKFIVANVADHRFCCNWDGNAVMPSWSLDGGTTWTRFSSLPLPRGTASTDPWAMSFGSIAVSASSIDNMVWLPTWNRPLHYTTDRGKTWFPVTLPGQMTETPGSHDNFYLTRHALVSDRVQAGTFYLLHTGNRGEPALAGVWRTTDGGRTWAKRFNGEPEPWLFWNAQMAAVPGKAGHLFLTPGRLDGLEGALRRSTDGGATWPVVPNVLAVRSVAFGAPSSARNYPAIYIVGKVRGDYGLWRSVDNAVSWQKLGQYPMGSFDNINRIEADKTVFGRLYLAMSGSGWMVGESVACTPQTYAFGDAQECVAVK